MTIYPYWYVRSRPPHLLHVRWQIRDEDGKILTQITSRPYFDGAYASNWAPGTLVDDAYRLPLPPARADQTYQLAAQLVVVDEQGGEEEATPAARIGLVAAPAGELETLAADYPLDLVYEDQVGLRGYDVAVCAGPGLPCKSCRPGHTVCHRPFPAQVAISKRLSATVQPGDAVAYTFYWQALNPIPYDYHGFVHVVDAQRQVLTQQDQVAGPLAEPASFWDLYYPKPDTYRLLIPPDAPNGLYWPQIGLYRAPEEVWFFTDVDRLAVTDGSGSPLGQPPTLPPIKVLGEAPALPPQHERRVRFDELGSLLGYSLALPQQGVAAGDTFTLTLHYRATETAPTCADAENGCQSGYIRFVQLHSPDLGMAAQRDGPPQEGGNPTWAWAPGEGIVEELTLRIAEDAAPGEYNLQIGFYHPQSGARLPAWDETGQPLSGDMAILTTLQVR